MAPGGSGRHAFPPPPLATPPRHPNLRHPIPPPPGHHTCPAPATLHCRLHPSRFWTELVRAPAWPPGCPLQSECWRSPPHPPPRVFGAMRAPFTPPAATHSWQGRLPPALARPARPHLLGWRVGHQRQLSRQTSCARPAPLPPPAAPPPHTLQRGHCKPRWGRAVGRAPARTCAPAAPALRPIAKHISHGFPLATRAPACLPPPCRQAVLGHALSAQGGPRAARRQGGGRGGRGLAGRPRRQGAAASAQGPAGAGAAAQHNVRAGQHW